MSRKIHRGIVGEEREGNRYQFVAEVTVRVTSEVIRAESDTSALAEFLHQAELHKLLSSQLGSGYVTRTEFVDYETVTSFECDEGGNIVREQWKLTKDKPGPGSGP